MVARECQLMNTCFPSVACPVTSVTTSGSNSCMTTRARSGYSAPENVPVPAQCATASCATISRTIEMSLVCHSRAKFLTRFSYAALVSVDAITVAPGGLQRSVPSVVPPLRINARTGCIENTLCMPNVKMLVTCTVCLGDSQGVRALTNIDQRSLR